MAENKNICVAYKTGNFLQVWRLLAQLKFCFMQLFIRKFDKTVYPSDRLELLGSM
jgi:hypothetical protein